jgi:hypothetical protein
MHGGAHFMNATELDVVIFQRDKWWIAQGLQYDIGAQAYTVEDAMYQFERALMGHIAICAENDVEPFASLPAAPNGYWKKYSGTRLRLEPIDEASFRVPTNIAPPKREFRLAA